MTGWSAVEDGPGRYTFRLDGVDVGTFSMLDTHPGTGRRLYPALLAGHAAAAFNDFDTTLAADTEHRYRAKGWPSAAAYHEQLELNRAVVADYPPSVRADITAAFERAGYTTPLTPDEMNDWQNTLSSILAAHDQQGHAA